MAEKKGYFKQGAWVTDETVQDASDVPGSAAPTQESSIEQRIGDMSGRVSRDIGDLFQLTRDLLTTEEGHRHIGELVNRAGNQLEKAINDLLAETGSKKSESKESTKSGAKSTVEKDS
jgi:hypothetical protein